MAFEALQGKMDVALYMLCSFIVCVFLVTSTPVSQFKGKGVHDEKFPNGVSRVSCVTVWGFKKDCEKNTYTYRIPTIGCSKVKSIFQATEAFYVISVFFSFLTCFLCGIYFIGIKIKLALIILGAFEIAFSLIPWALMTAIWHRDYCGGSNSIALSPNGLVSEVSAIPYGKELRNYFRTSAAYGFTIAAWCIQIVGFILLLAVTL